MIAQIFKNLKSTHKPTTGIWVLFVSGAIFFSPGFARAEYIESFISDIVVKKDSTFDVVEHIAYVFTEDRHGIIRCIPRLHNEKSTSILKDRYIDIDTISVQMDTGPVPFEIDEKNLETCIKIGDPNATIIDAHTYDIAYHVSGAISYEEYGGADLYWNVNGNGWKVPMKHIEARVSSPDEVMAGQRACYRGLVGKSNSCESVSIDTEGTVHFVGALFNANEGMTIAQALVRQNIAYDVRERFKPILVWGIGILVFLGIGGTVLYRYKTKFKTNQAIIPQYEPYPEVKPMYAGFLFDKRLDPRDITAGIVYLAEQGFIKITKIDRTVFFFFDVDDYELEILRSAHEIIDQFDKEIITLIFGDETVVGAKVTLSDLKTNYAHAQENLVRMRALNTALEEDVTKKDFFTGFFFTRRTRKGYEALDHLKGFKDYLRVTETQRYIFHNAPERNAEHFMEYLPYAIAFGVEKEWAKTFEGITIPNPSWYNGGNLGTFNAVTLTQSLGGFSTAFASTTSGSSASSGGGFSGGGSGGGGGGSW